MSASRDGIDADALVAVARAAGYTITRHQIRRWHLHDLLPRPLQGPGRGRGKGRLAIYPAGTNGQLLALCELRLTRKLDLADCGWWLWWRGFEVAAVLWRERLIKEVARIDDLLWNFVEAAKDRKNDTDIYDWILDNAIFLKRSRSVPQFLRTARKRLTEDSLATFLRSLIEIATGEFGGWSNWDKHRRSEIADPDATRDEATFEKGLGVHRARTDRVTGAEPWLSPNFRTDELFRGLSASLGKSGFATRLGALQDRELAMLRDELKLITLPPKLLAELSEEIFGLHAFGFEAAGNLIVEDNTKGAIVIFGLFAITRPFLGPAIDPEQLAANRNAAENTSRTYRELRRIAQSNNALADLLSPSALRKALTSPSAMAQLRIDIQNALDRQARHAQTATTEKDG